MSEPANYSWVPWVITVLGWPFTAILAYRLGLRSKRIEREEAAKSAIKTRRREFCSFLRGWKADFSRLHMRSHGYSRDGGAFVTVIPLFVQKADMVRDHISSDAQKRFGELVAAISARNGGAVGNKEPYDELLKDFDELLSIAENA